jgi:calcineurin-like phosphoesterase family protein
MRDGKRTWRRAQVLGDAWLRNLDEITEDGRSIDIVTFTGDVADWGTPDEYRAATPFIEETLRRLNVPGERFFVIPGNHDVHRATEAAAWTSLRQGIGTQPQAVSEWMAGSVGPPFGFATESRDAVLRRQDAFHDWVTRDLGRDALAPERSPHGRLGYRVTLALPGLAAPVHVIGLDSAWLAGDDADAGKLWLTDDQIGLLCLQPDGTPLDGFRLALVHHPLSDLADHDSAGRLLASNVDLLLRGHQHRPLATTQHEPGRVLRELAAGCLYEGHLGNRHPNALHVIDVTLNGQGRPLRHDIRFRAWSPNGHWHDDSALYAEARHGRLTWQLADEPRAHAPAAVQAPSPPVSRPPPQAPARLAPTMQAVRKALEHGFTGPELTLLVADAFPEVRGGLESIASPVLPLPNRIFELVTYCERRGWLPRLAAAIEEARRS